MKIQSVYLHGLRGLPDIDLDFVDPATLQPRLRTVIAGSNGTGKTTILDVVFALLEIAKGTKPSWLRPNGLRAGIVVVDLPIAPPYPLVVEIGNAQQLVGVSYLSGRRALSSGPEPSGASITREVCQRRLCRRGSHALSPRRSTSPTASTFPPKIAGYVPKEPAR